MQTGVKVYSPEMIAANGWIREGVQFPNLESVTNSKYLASIKFSEQHLSVIVRASDGMQLIGIAFRCVTEGEKHFKRILKCHLKELEKKYSAKPKYKIANFATLNELRQKCGTAMALTAEDENNEEGSETSGIFKMKQRKNGRTKENVNVNMAENSIGSSGDGGGGDEKYVETDHHGRKQKKNQPNKPKKKRRQHVLSEISNFTTSGNSNNTTINTGLGDNNLFPITLPNYEIQQSFQSMVNQISFPSEDIDLLCNLMDETLFEDQYLKLNSGPVFAPIPVIDVPDLSSELQYITLPETPIQALPSPPPPPPPLSTLSTMAVAAAEPPPPLPASEPLQYQISPGELFSIVKTNFEILHQRARSPIDEDYLKIFKSKRWPTDFTKEEQMLRDEVFLPFFHIFIEKLQKNHNGSNDEKEEYSKIVYKLQQFTNQKKRLNAPPVATAHLQYPPKQISDIVVSVNEAIQFQLQHSYFVVPQLDWNRFNEEEITHTLFLIYTLWKDFLEEEDEEEVVATGVVAVDEEEEEEIVEELEKGEVSIDEDFKEIWEHCEKKVMKKQQQQLKQKNQVN